MLDLASIRLGLVFRLLELIARSVLLEGDLMLSVSAQAHRMMAYVVERHGIG
jgi:hypothetical protein